MTELTEIQNTIAQQIGAKELKFARFNLLINGKNDITVNKGKKFLTIEYNEGTDTYKVTKGKLNKSFEKEEDVLENVYWEDLRPMIIRHFKGFEYVMDRLIIRG